MYVCSNCHEKDRNAIDCQLSFDHHAALTRLQYSECIICGEFEEVISCRQYNDNKVKTITLKCPKCKLHPECSRLKQFGDSDPRVTNCQMYNKSFYG